MLRKIDRIFLQQVHDFSCMGRPVTAIGLYDAGYAFDRTSMLLHKSINLLSDAKAIERAEQLNTGARVQRVVVVRLFAELMAGIEDLGSLCFAIKHRKNESIFKRYSLSESEHGTFLSEIFDCKKEKPLNLPSMLKIPEIGKLKGLPVDVYGDIEKAYNQIAKNIQGAAMLFKSKNVKTGKIDGRDDLVYVVYHTQDKNKPSDKLSKSSIRVKTYNKIKHRFLVFDTMDLLEKAIAEGDIGLEFDYIPFSYESKNVKDLCDFIMTISACMADIATVLLLLENNGVEI